MCINELFWLKRRTSLDFNVGLSTLGAKLEMEILRNPFTVNAPTLSTGGSWEEL
jgi:hypothetical protein